MKYFGSLITFMALFSSYVEGHGMKIKGSGCGKRTERMSGRNFQGCNCANTGNSGQVPGGPTNFLPQQDADGPIIQQGPGALTQTF
jgi:hypothetical protein